MRLFAALLPPPAVLEEIEHAVSPCRTAWPDLRWVRPDHWHVTLAFYGEVADAVVPDLARRLERVAARHPVLDVSFAGAGAFPARGRARVLWAGLDGNRRLLAALAASATAAGRRAGATGTDTRQRFHPHLTLARCRVPTDVHDLVEALSGYAGSAWRADAIHLVRSALGPTVRYETVQSWPLRPD